MEVEAKIRYKAKESKARIYPIDDKVKVVLKTTKSNYKRTVSSILQR